MKKTTVAAAVAGFLLAGGVALQAEAAEQPETVVVKMKQQNTDRLEQSFTVQSATVQQNQSIVTVEVPAGKSTTQLIQELEKRSDVELAEPNYRYKKLLTPTDQYFSTQYHHGLIGTAQAWDITMGSPDVHVAILDDGLDTKHPELVGRFAATVNTAPKFSIEEHGTHVAGIVGAIANNGVMGAGVAPKTGMYFVDVFNGEDAYLSDIVAGIKYAVDSDADIISMSLGGPYYSEILDDAVQNAHNEGLVIIAASGNESTSITGYPAGFNNVLSVGSTNRSDAVSTYSNWGETLDLVAPGESIYSTTPNNGFLRMSGTSMATPVVAGVAALIKAQHPHFTNTDIENQLLATTKDLGATGWDPKSGYGRVDAYAALTQFDLLAPTLSDVSSSQEQVTGTVTKTLPKSTIMVRNSFGQIAKKSGFTGNGSFTLEIPKQPAGTVLTVQLVDSFGNQSPLATVTVTASSQMEVWTGQLVTNYSTRLRGYTAPGSQVTIYKGTTKLATGTADNLGKFDLEMSPQTIGTSLRIVAEDENTRLTAENSVTVQNGAYPDLSTSHWAHGAVAYLRDYSIIGGYPDGTFRPDRLTTRAEAARMIAQALELPYEQGMPGFKDVPSSHWASDFIAAATAAGIFTGNPDGTFDPSGQLTRAQMAVILNKSYELKSSGSVPFTDVRNTHWAYAAIGSLYESGITAGYPDGTFKPSNPTKRSEFSQFLMKAMN